MQRNTFTRLIFSLIVSSVLVAVCSILGIYYTRYYQIPKNFRH
jgi:hypothetical protein